MTSPTQECAGKSFAARSDQILELDGRSIAVGLLWQPAQERVPLLEQAAAVAGPGDRFDLRAYWRSGAQIGFCSTEDGYRTGLTVGATIFNEDLLGNKWLAAYPINDDFGVWIVAARDGYVFEDRILHGSSQAQDRIRSAAYGTDWDTVIAPSEWNIDNASAVDLASVVAFPSAARLRPISLGRQLMRPGMTVLSGLAAIWLCWLGVDAIRTVPADPITPPSASLPIQRPEPWVGAPAIEEFSKKCMLAMDRIGREVIGWELSGVACQQSAGQIRAEARWRRSTGSPELLRSLLAHGSAVEIGFGERNATATATLESVVPAAASGTPWTADEIASRLVDRFQTIGLELNYSDRPAHFTPDGTIAEFGHYELSIAASAAIDEISSLLQDVGGLVPTSLAYDPRSNIWLLSATAYHRPARNHG